MDQVKIGKFIAERRKCEGLTQAQLAEKLNITDRAVSKWETGKSLPDAMIMLDLCSILKITVNDLLCGEVVTMDNYNKKLENNLIQSVKEKQKADKRLLNIEWAVLAVCMAILLALCAVAAFVEMEDWLRILIIVIGALPVFILGPFMIKIEQTAGYYECGKCSHKYIPAYARVFFSMHIGRTRYMKCPKCNERSWHKKVLTKE